MPAPNPPRLYTETLANGLRVTLRHVPDLKRAAAVLRVAAGSHDAPLAWPGLAHFLEHLLFLGTERFPADQGLMAYVLGHAGQVNARTNERTTDYFFELAPQAFNNGLDRLSDMLAHPHLMFALEALPDASPLALAFLCHWLNATKPGGLLAALRERGIADQLKAEPLYQYAGQALLHIEFTLSDNATAVGIREQLTDWLSFFAQQDWTGLRDEYTTLLQRQQQVSTALQLARQDSEQREAALSEPGVIALKDILKQMGAEDNFSGQWQLPAPNPFLQAEAPAPNAGLIRGQTSAHRGLRTFAQDRSRSRRERSPMQFSQALPDNTAEGAVYLRWRLVFTPGSHLQANLESRLQPLRED
eukprot:gene13430-13206_t